MSAVGGHRVARVFALPGGAPLYTLQARGVTTAAFSRDGTLLITGGFDQAAIWDARTGRKLQPLEGNGRQVTAVAFGPDGHLAVTGSAGGATRVWNVHRGIRVFPLLGHTNAVTDTSFSRDGRFLVTASKDGTARVWAIATGTQVSVLRGRPDAVTAAAWSPDGSRSPPRAPTGRRACGIRAPSRSFTC